MERHTPSSRSTYGKNSFTRRYLNSSVSISAEITRPKSPNQSTSRRRRQRVSFSRSYSPSLLTQLTILVQVVSAISATFPNTDSSLNLSVLKKFPEQYGPRFDTKMNSHSSKNNSALLISSQYDRVADTFKSPSVMPSWYEEIPRNNKTSSGRSSSSFSKPRGVLKEGIPDKVGKFQSPTLSLKEGFNHLRRRSSRSARLYVTKSEHQKNNDSDYKCPVNGTNENNTSSFELNTYISPTSTCSNSENADQTDEVNQTITIGFLSPYNQNQFSLGAMRLAVDTINNNASILPDVRLQFIAVDLGSSELMLTSQPIKIMTQMRDKGAVAFIGGPEDTCVSEALVAAAWNLPMISFKCSDHLVSDKRTYPTFARTLPPSSKVSKSVVALLKSFGWNKIVLVVGHGRMDRWYKVVIDAFTLLATKNDINITAHYSLLDYIPENYPEMGKIVAESYTRTRVYVFIGEHMALVHLVRAMSEKGLFDNGEYVIISVDDKRNLPRFFDIDYLDPFIQNGTEDNMLKAYRSVLKLIPSHPQTENFGVIESIVANYSSQYPFCAPYHRILFPDAEVPVEAAYLYDAVMIYARALDEAIKEGVRPDNGTNIFQRIRNRSYQSIQGYDVLIDGNGDAEGNYTVISLLPVDPSSPLYPNTTYNYKDLNTNATIGMSMQPVGNFQQGPNTTGDDIAEFRYFNESRPIQWVSGAPPKPEPVCGFDHELCVTKPDWGTIVSCSIFASIFIVALILAARHYRYEQKLACLLWKIDMKDVIMIPMGPPEPCNGTKSTVALCRQLLGTAVDADAPLELACKKAYTRIGFYKGMVVAIKPINKRSIDLTRTIQKELKQIREFRHENIIPFIGASVDHGSICILTAYSARGSLEDVLQNEDLHLDKMFLASLVFDLIKGMIYLHDSEIVSHGNLKSSNCLVDSRWVLQIADFGLHEFKAGQEQRRDVISREKEERKLLWRAPELLRDPNAPLRGTQKSDVYSFGIVLYELIGRSGPWGKTLWTVSEIIEKVGSPVEGCIIRPPTRHLDVSESILKCLHACWEEDPELRPDFRYIRVRLKEMQTGLKPNIFDNMLSIMEKYACNLEDLVQERTTQLMEEKKKTDALLHRMLPKSVAESLKRGEPVEAESFDSVTIYFSDVVGFTALSAVSTPMQVVELLNDLYTCFDSIISHYDVYKVETIGDAYMVVSGLPIRNGNQHAGEVASMALHLLDRIRNFEIRHRPGERLKLRIGIHSGPVVTGVVGLKMPRYCLFGDTVNTASRMESSGEALKIHISDVTKNLLETLGGYDYEERGIIPIKGKGEMRTYWLVGEDPSRTRRNSTEEYFLSGRSQRDIDNQQGVLIPPTNNNCIECACGNEPGEKSCSEGPVGFCSHKTLADEVNGILLNEGANHLPNTKIFKPTTWLLAECNNGKLENGGMKKTVGGRYVSCSNVFQECKASIIKELKKTGSVTANQSNRFRSAPIITFIDTTNPYNGNAGFPYEEPKFV